MKSISHKPSIAVHKFSSCDGCQLAFLNLGEALLTLAGRVDIIHFAEAGPLDSAAPVDIAFVEGSISTPAELERIQQVRANSRILISIGACATSGGLQALRNTANADEWMAAVYPSPEFLDSLATATPIAEHVRVDFELWGCPINSEQLLAAVNALLLGVAPLQEKDSLCMECKRQGNVCVLVTEQQPCLGPVTQTGCGALCPRFGRDCYGCYGPKENANGESLATRFAGFGLLEDEICRKFLAINSHAPEFATVATRIRGTQDDG